MGLENREKSNQIFDGSKMNVPGQGIKTVQVFKNILKNKNSLFSPQQIKDELNEPKPSPSNSSTPQPTPTNTPTNTITPTNTMTQTQSRTPFKTPLQTRTQTMTPNTTTTPTPTVTQTKTTGITPLPTRTNTPTNTQTSSLNPTPSSSITPTPETTPTNTPSMTPSLTPNGCFCYDVEITQSDLNSAYGNTEQIANGVITIQYFSCSEEFITLTATTAGIYQICNRKFETLESFGIEALLVYTQLDMVYNNYLNPNSFSSTILTSYNPCSINNDCIPPTPTSTVTSTMTPTNTISVSFSPSQTPTNTLTPSFTPTNEPTPTQTPTNTQTPTLTPYICYSYDVTITQTDIDRASGNTGTNGVVSITYYSCDEVVEELEVTVAGVYTVCNKYIKSLEIYNTEIYLVYRQDDESYNSYDNPLSFTSSFVKTSTICPTPPPPPPCNPLDLEPIVLTNISPIVGLTMTIKLSFYTMYATIIDWGDGVIDSFSEGVNVQISKSHTFTSSQDVKIYSCDFNSCFIFEVKLVNGPFDYRFSTSLSSITQILPNLQYLRTSLHISYFGNIQSISQISSLVGINIGCLSNQLTGDISTINCPNLNELYIYNGDIYGDINNLNQSIIKLNLTSIDYITVTGNIGTFFSNRPSFQNFSVTGKNTIFGDITGVLSTKNGLINFNLLGNNTITGDLTNNMPKYITFFYVDGFNTLYGDTNFVNNCLDLNNLVIKGNNTISGSIANLNTNIRYITIDGNNTISGSIANLKPSNKLLSLSIIGNNTLTGSLDNIPFLSGLQNLILQGNNTITGPVNVFLNRIPTNISRLNLTTTLPGGLTSPEVDALLNGLTNKIWTPNSSSLQILGSNQPRTNNSIAAYNYLITKVYEVMVN